MYCYSFSKHQIRKPVDFFTIDQVLKSNKNNYFHTTVFLSREKKLFHTWSIVLFKVKIKININSFNLIISDGIFRAILMQRRQIAVTFYYIRIFCLGGRWLLMKSQGVTLVFRGVHTLHLQTIHKPVLFSNPQLWLMKVSKTGLKLPIGASILNRLDALPEHLLPLVNGQQWQEFIGMNREVYYK